MARAKRMMRTAVNSVTFRQYSLIQAVGWLILGNFAAGHLGWWLISLIALGIAIGAGILTDLIRMGVGLPPAHAKDARP